MKNMWKKIIVCGMLVTILGASTMTGAAKQQAVPDRGTLFITDGYSQADGWVKLPFGEMHHQSNQSTGFQSLVNMLESNDFSVAWCDGRTTLVQSPQEITIGLWNKDLVNLTKRVKDYIYGAAMVGTTADIEVQSPEAMVRLKIDLTYSIIVHSAGSAISAGYLLLQYQDNYEGSENINFEESIYLYKPGHQEKSNTVSYIIEVPSGTIGSFSFLTGAGSTTQAYGANPSVSIITKGMGYASVVASLDISVL